MVELEDKLLEYIDSTLKTISPDEIMENFTDDEKELVNNALNELEKKGKIFKNKKGNYSPWHKGLGRVYGQIILTSRGLGLIKDNDEAIFINREYLGGALNGDTVIVRDIKTVRKRKEGKVEKILDRKRENILCEVSSLGGRKKLIPRTANKDLEVVASKEDLKRYVDGDLLLVSIPNEKIDDKFNGRIIKKVCHKDDPKSDLISIAVSHGFDVDFPKEVMDEVSNIPTDIKGEDISNRVDLRDKMIFTIDGAHTKDIDDAISLEKLSNGNYFLGVHIADVSHYVKEGSAIYNEAMKRGTSVYMIDSVIPMLPRELSNGICSLNPEEDRLAKTCLMEIDTHGNILNSKIFDSVIRSRKKMTYEDVNEILENGNIPEGYEEYVDTLKEMNILSHNMSKRKRSRGAIEFVNPEIVIEVDDKGVPYGVSKNEQKSGEVLIENFMLAANESVAKYFSRNNLPCIYRVHDYPNGSKMHKIISVICRNHREIKEPESFDANDISAFVDNIRSLDEYSGYVEMILRSMSKAEYSSNNIGHYAQAFKFYARFSSPIREFPNLVNHSLLNLYKNEDIDKIDLESLDKRLSELASISSQSEQEAARAEYDAIDLKVAEYMKNHIGEEYDGIITSVNNHGMRVKLDNLIEGSVHIGDIEPKGFYEFNHNNYSLESADYYYQLGQKIRIRVKDANVENRRTNFTAIGRVKYDSRNNSKVKTLKHK